MPKAKWGAGDAPLTAADIDSAEVQETRTRYSGEVPPAGTYRWTIGSMKQDTSNAGNDKVVIRLELDGTWRKNHKQYDGAPVWQHLALTTKNAPQVRNFLDSIGATSKDLMEGSIVDENGYITKLGRVGDPTGLLVFANVKRRKRTAEYPDVQLEVEYAGYSMADEGSADEAAGGDADLDEPPF
jgi:hypothetical protein